jgi:hypothetical protein
MIFIITQKKKTIRIDEKMTKQDILERIQDILYQDGNVQELDLLRHDLENDIIEEKNND